MTDNELIVAVARLDGRTVQPYIDGDKVKWEEQFFVGWECVEKPKYLTSHDSVFKIINRIKDHNQLSSDPEDYNSFLFVTSLCKILNIKLWDNGKAIFSTDNIFELLRATPKQLCLALIEANKVGNIFISSK